MPISHEQTTLPETVSWICSKENFTYSEFEQIPHFWGRFCGLVVSCQCLIT
nr:MAG TPA: hypothetical protein [Caudoviricetes sp.]